MLPRVLALLLFSSLSLSAQVPGGPLTSTAEVRQLDRREAARGLPVKMRGVVTGAFSKASGNFIFDDGVSGVYISVAEARTLGLLPAEADAESPPALGTLLEITGITAPGGFAPVILPRTIQRLGTAPLPPAQLVTVADLQTGRFDCERVQVRGVVQHAEFGERQVDAVRLELAAIGGHFVAYAVQPAGFDLAKLVDAEVELTGVALTFFNERAELVGARVQLEGIDSVRIVQPAPESPFAAPPAQLDELLPFSPAAPWLHRRLIRGTVTVGRPGGFFYLQEGDRAVRVSTRDPARLSPGDRVEVSGFVELWDSFAELRGAVFRQLGTVSVPAAEPITRAAVLAGERGPDEPDTPSHLDGRRVVLRGRLEKVEPGAKFGRRLSLDCDGNIIFATLANDEPPAALERLVPGSDVSVTGVCQIQLSVGRPTLRNPVPTGFQLLVHSPEDVAVLRVPSWWTPQRLWFALGGTAAVLALALAWAWMLRRRVARRSAQLEAEIGARRDAAIEFDATLRERKRLAADLHDTLEQALTGLALQLEVVDIFRGDEPERSTHHLRLARQFLDRSREDVRRSVWNLRAQGLEGQTLVEALGEMLSASTVGRSVAAACEVEGEPIALPDFIASNLLLLAQESVTNALKHAHAATIRVRVVFDADGVALSVEDDGRGFEVAQAPGLKEGHFGLQGMRERIKRLGGALEIRSAPGAGTKIVARVPTHAFEVANDS